MPVRLSDLEPSDWLTKAIAEANARNTRRSVATVDHDGLKLTAEESHQANFFEWCQIQVNLGTHPELAECYHVPNGGYRDKRTAAKLQVLGVKPGVPDLCLDVMRGGYGGWRVELKAPGGKLSVVQGQTIERLKARGYWAKALWGWEAVRDDVLAYLALD